jgi:hypothetical protein
MPTNEPTHRVRVSPPSSLRTEMNILAAVVAVGICLVILALLANTPPPRAAHRARSESHAPARALGRTRTASRS